MAHKSKSQKRRAAARKQARREANNVSSAVETKVSETAVKVVEDVKVETKKTEAKAKKESGTLLDYVKSVRGELARTTFPGRVEVKNASFVVLGALTFFGLLFYAVDSGIVPLLFEYSSL